MARVSERQARPISAPRSAAPAQAAAKAGAEPGPRSTPENDFAPGEAKSRSQNPLRADEKAYLLRLSKSHLTATDAELATLFAADPKVGHRRAWSAAEVAHLRQACVLLSPRASQAAVAPLLAKEFRARPAAESLAGALKAIEKKFPHVDRAMVLSLARTDRGLAKAIRPLWMRERDITPSTRPVELTQAQAATLGLPREILERSLSREGSPLVGAVLGKLAALERDAGNNDGVLSARDALQADPLLKAVLAEVDARLGTQAHPLTDIAPLLPAVLATLGERGKRGGPAAPLTTAAAEETLQGLVTRYRAEVLEGGTTPTNFAEKERLGFDRWPGLQKAFPQYFPLPQDVRIDEKRLTVIAGLYRQMVDGELSRRSFFARAVLTPPELQLLQASDPRRFPKDDAVPYWEALGKKETRGPTAETKALAKEYVSDVVQGHESRAAFIRSHGLTEHDFVAVAKANPGLFPPLGGAAARAPFTRTEIAIAVAKRATELFKADVLVKLPELLERLNADPEFVAAYGAVGPSRYDGLRHHHPAGFPNLRDVRAQLEQLKVDVARVLKAKPGLSPSQLTLEMQKQYPNFRIDLVWKLRAAYPELLPYERAGKTATAAERQRDAKDLAAAMRARPGRTMAQHAASLARGREYVTASYLQQLRSRTPELFTGIEEKKRSMVRSNLAWTRQLELVVELLPPGATQRQVVAALNALLTAAGLEPFRALPPGMLSKLAERTGGLEASAAARTAEVVAEYARAAAEGASEADILAQVAKDYPTLDAFHLTTALRAWKKSPAAFPALKPFFEGETLRLEGRGEQVKAPRYLGGWDVERALLGPAKSDPALARRLADLAQFPRIPARLELLDASVADLQGARPLDNTNFLWVTHALGTTVPLAYALKEAGLSMSRTVVVSSPYGTNDGVSEVLREEGFDLRTPRLDTADYRAQVEKAVKEVADRARKNHQTVVVMDDGGLVSSIVNGQAEYADIRHAFKIVEQTNGGITYAESAALETPVVNMAGSETKKLEGPMVGRVVADKVLQSIGAKLGDFRGQSVSVVGFGTIGEAVAEALHAKGAKVTVTDASPARQKAARAAGYAVAPLRESLAKAKVLVGTTGRTSVTLEDLKALPDGAAFLSASSKQVEFEMGALKQKATSATTLEPGAPTIRLPNVEYRLGKKALVALGDGWPINFDGDVNSVPADDIQLTRALMFESIIQASNLYAWTKDGEGLVQLDPERDAKLQRRWAAYRKKHPEPAATEDPRDWADVLRRTLATIAA